MFAALGLDERLLKALEPLGFTQPTPIQQAIIPLVLAGRDVQASAETGTGKTAAFMLPLVQRLHLNPKPRSNTRALIILPTKELAAQTVQQCEALAAFTQVTSALVVGGLPFREQQALLRKNPEVVIGTPGRLLEHLQKGSLLLDDLEVLVLDEADRMLDMGFREDVLSLVQASSPDRQTLLLSATLRHEGIGRIASEVLKSPEQVSTSPGRGPHEQIRQQRILADDPAHKQQLLSWLLANERYDKALIFTNTRVNAEALSLFLRKQRGKGVGCLHGEMPHEDRRRIMRAFRDGHYTVLVATDLAARGLDIKGVDLVVNFAMARSGDDYVHRVGRTGRAGEQGLAISLVSAPEWNQSESVARYLGMSYETRSIPGMEAKFRGEVKARRKKDDGKDSKKEGKDRTKAKAKERHRHRKNIGKRRSPGKTDSEALAKPAAGKAKARSTSKAKERPAVTGLPDAEGLAPLSRKPWSKR